MSEVPLIDENASELVLKTGQRLPLGAIESMQVRLLPVKSLLITSIVLIVGGFVFLGIWMNASDDFANEAIKLNKILRDVGSPSYSGNPYAEQLLNNAGKIADNANYFAALSKKMQFQGLLGYLVLDGLGLIFLIAAYLRGSYGLHVKAMGSKSIVQCGSKGDANEFHQKIMSLKFSCNGNSGHESLKKAS